MVARELHEKKEEDEQTFHLHAYIQWTKRRYTTFKKLFLTGPDGVVYKGRFLSCRNAKDVAEYCQKDGDYITDLTPEEIKKLAKNKPTFADVMARAKEGDEEGAFENWTEGMPRDALMIGPARMRESIRGFAQNAPEPVDSRMKFLELPRYKQWDKYLRKRLSLVMVGVSGTGKSWFARKHALKHPCVCQRLDGLKKYNVKRHDGLVFDDMYFGNHARETQLHLTGVEDLGEINVKMTMATIAPYTERIFICNKFPFSLPIRPELRRRIHVVWVKEDMRIMDEEQTAFALKPPDDLDALLANYKPADDEETESWLDKKVWQE